VSAPSRGSGLPHSGSHSDPTLKETGSPVAGRGQ
jgi:hypothetical protein